MESGEGGGGSEWRRGGVKVSGRECVRVRVRDMMSISLRLCKVVSGDVC